jgi:hypothetical protein
MPSTATGWLNSRFGGAGGGVVSAFTGQQSVLQNHFAGQLATIGNADTRRVMKKGIWRVGKLLWAASMPTAPNGAKFAGWTKTKRSTGNEQNLQMNCWEAVMYLAFQCGLMSQQKCVNFYQLATANDVKLRALFGTATQVNVGGGAVPNMGDVLTFVDTNVNPAPLNHVALYAGTFGGQHYVLHNLSYHGHTTGLQMGGGFHFESFTSVEMRYGGNVTIYYNTPFWQAGAPTHLYFSWL